jgi:hypothetical protein
VASLTPSNAQKAFYDDSVGLCTYNATLGGHCVIQFDGAAYLRSYQPRANDFTLDLQRPGEYLLRDSLASTAIYLFDKATGIAGALVSSGASGHVSDALVRASDRFITVSGGTVQYKALTLGGSWTTEATLTGAGTLAPTVSRTRDANVIALAYANGTVLYYDVEARAQVAGSAYIGTNNGAWYSPKHDIFVALASAMVKVFANAVRPSSLSNPAAVSPITQGRVSEVQVRLLGANSDPCADELVDWSITAGDGALKYAQTTTDADGYATNEYVAPVTGGAGSPFGNVTIQAQVNF